ncbi:MAG: peptide-methionine (S)-S-oxide reductase MsrA [Bacteroidales bacterium]|jgi:peptide-methionine (S)-S-oxide reductase|nr:peptide-methionine (S)-S-oxide reductase MsrA [Bacteroidales bacterium]
MSNISYRGTAMMHLLSIFTIFITLFLNQNIYAQHQTNMELATFGSGCFWCTEAIFEQLLGVESAKSGFSGGKTENPTYEEVCIGETGHAEVIQVSFDPKIITYNDLLEVFWQTHDPTSLNKQGGDVGTQYRSAIFYHNKVQKEIAESYKNKLEQAKIYDNPIVTEITQFDTFHKAENYHQDYYNNNKSQSYCSMVITPKIDKFKKVFKDKLK